ncbi:MAG: RagB/SusD family nutrient uptake outer membrane protein [Salinivirgaceae bacterium]|nr:RagB/SusD family nutrient uptake outer membrane protein [Salinivirgaceae bacterium]
MKISNLFIIFGILLSVTITTSCTDWLTIKPESETVLEDFWQSESQVNQMLSACYKSMTEYSYLSRVLVWGELRSDNVTFGNNIPDDIYKMLNVDISISNSYNAWGAIYTTINLCNTFLYYAPDVVDIDQNFTKEELQTLEAEVLTIRALSYFYLVRTFQEVPWVDFPSIDDTQDYSIPKSSEAFVLEKIVTDLNAALLYARDRFDTPEYKKGRITKNAVRALLADIYLWQEDYDLCIQTCNQLIDNMGNVLLNGETVLQEVFVEGNSAESIFELQFDDENNFNSVIRDFYGHNGNEKGFWSFPYVLVTGTASPFNYLVANNVESDDDLRLLDFLNPEPGGDRYFVFKYAGSERIQEENSTYSDYNYREVTSNWIFYRLSDIILMEAEALIQLENFTDALALINQTYLRSNPEVIDGGLKIENYNSKNEMEKLLLRERQRELMFEGKRWFDLMRLARRADSPSPLLSYVMKKYSGTASVEASKMSVMDALYLPIHSNELKANSALEQNPFYKTYGENQ